MERNLPPAPQTLLQYAWDKAIQAGINIKQDDFILLHRIVIDYFNNVGEGKRVMLKMLKASISEADYTRQYYQAGHVGDEEKQLDYRGIVEYKGWIYKGRAVPHNAVEFWEKPDLEACESCGGLFPKIHCVVTVKRYSNGKEHLENMCNSCRLKFDDPKIRDTASNKTCESCSITTCRYWPKRNNLVAVPTQRQIEHKPQTLQQRYGAV
jgi:hypothetical protein